MIGVFDSGFGGLTILKEFLRRLPQYDYTYLGDTARAPYGNRSPEVVYEWTRQAVDFLFKKGCRLVILACFSASAVALRRLQREWLPKHKEQVTKHAPFDSQARSGRALSRAEGNKEHLNILGVLIPLAEEAVKISRFGQIGILATRATVQSRALETELLKRRQDMKIFSQAAPLLVPLIEEGWLRRPETKKILRHYLRPFKKQKTDTLLLACTHYPLLCEEIAGAAGRRVKVVNPAGIVARSLADYLKRHPEIENRLEKDGKVRFLTTNRLSDFECLGSRFLGRQIKAEEAGY